MTSQPIILLHGALGSQAQLAALQKELESQYDVYSLDFEGHGDNRSNGDFNMDVFVQNVLDLIDDHKLNNAPIFGYSMGGYVALHLALLHPERVEKIITYGTKFDWKPETSAREVKMLDPGVIEEKVPKFAHHLQAIHGKDNWKTVLHKTADMMIGLGDEPPLTAESLSKIQQQVMIAIGTEDNMVSLEESEATAVSIKNGTLEILEEFVHPLERNDPQVMANLIKEYLEKT